MSERCITLALMVATVALVALAIWQIYGIERACPSDGFGAMLHICQSHEYGGVRFIAAVILKFVVL